MTTARETERCSAPVFPGSGRLRPLGIDEVTITGGFWGERQRVNSEATLPHIRSWLDREGWIDNFDLVAAGTEGAGRRGAVFSDSEIYKYLEAMAWDLRRRPDAARESEFRELVARVGAAQQPDGYLSTAFGSEGQDARWSALDSGHALLSRAPVPSCGRPCSHRSGSRRRADGHRAASG